MCDLPNQKNCEKDKIRLSTLLSKIVVLVALVVFVMPIQGQQPFQDGKGEGTIFVPDGGFAQINIADSSIRLGYLRNVSNEDLIFGFNLSGKLTGTRATLINNNQAAPDAKVSFTIGINDPFTEVTKSKIDPNTGKDTGGDLGEIFVSRRLRNQLQKLLWEEKLLDEKQILPEPKTAKNLIEYLGEVIESGLLRGVDIGKIFNLPELKKYAPNFSRIVFQGGYAFKQYNLYDPAAVFDKQVYKKNFHSPSAQLIYFRQLTGRKLLGASIGVDRSNNSDDLTEIEVRDFTSAISGSTTREVSRIRKALRGDFKQSTRAFINTDFVWFPAALESRIGVNIFTRSGLIGEERGIRPGVGLFFSEKGSPTRVIGGVSVSVDNRGKANLSLIAGYNF